MGEKQTRTVKGLIGLRTRRARLPSQEVQDMYYDKMSEADASAMVEDMVEYSRMPFERVPGAYAIAAKAYLSRAHQKKPQN